MQTIELFSGTGSFSAVARRLGHRTFTVHNVNSLTLDHCADILRVRAKSLPRHPDMLWTSPPCEAFSVAAIGKNWHRDGRPKTKRASLAICVVTRTLALIGAAANDNRRAA